MDAPLDPHARTPDDISAGGDISHQNTVPAPGETMPGSIEPVATHSAPDEQPSAPAAAVPPAGLSAAESPLPQGSPTTAEAEPYVQPAGPAPGPSGSDAAPGGASGLPSIAARSAADAAPYAQPPAPAPLTVPAPGAANAQPPKQPVEPQPGLPDMVAPAAAGAEPYVPPDAANPVPATASRVTETESAQASPALTDAEPYAQQDRSLFVWSPAADAPIPVAPDEALPPPTDAAARAGGPLSAPAAGDIGTPWGAERDRRIEETTNGAETDRREMGATGVVAPAGVETAPDGDGDDVQEDEEAYLYGEDPRYAAPRTQAPVLRVPRLPRPRLQPHHFILAAIVLVGAVLRYYGLNWDLGAALHPDERHVTDLVAGLNLPASWSQFITPNHASPLEPGDFAYGSLPLYLYWIVGHIAIWLGSWMPGLSGWQDALGGGILITGRAVSAAAGVITILLVYLLGLRLYSRTVGLLAAAFFALCVLDIQLSHFLTVDTTTTLFATLAIYYCVRVAQERRPADFLWAGASVGAALACKASVLALLLPLVVAPFVPGAVARATARRAPGLLRRTVTNGWVRLGWLIIAAVPLLAVFFITQPYAWIDWNNYINDVLGQAHLASGQSHVFYTDKFYNTPPFWYHLENMVPWELGWPLGLAAMAGVIAAAVRALIRRERGEAVVIIWVLAYFISTGGQFMKYLRYMLPIMPELCVLGAIAVLPAVVWTARRARVRGAPLGVPRWQFVLAGGVLALTFLYALAYDNIYSTLNTRLAASLWMETHIRPGTPFTTENFDETLPWGFAGHPVPPGYNGTQIADLAGGDTLQAWTGGVANGPPAPNSYAAILANAQYVTIASVRVMGTIPHLPQAFPYESRYYRLLFDGALGFRQVAYFSNHPNLFGLSLDDYPADQNFSEYDHPPVWIFQRVRAVSATQTAALITDNWKVHDVASIATPKPTLLLSGRDRKANAAGPTYAQEFPATSLPMQWPLPVWLFWLEVLGLLALPLTLRLLRRLPDRGVVLAKTVGLLLTVFVTWIGASLHLLSYNRPLILIAAGVVAVASLLWGLPLGEVVDFVRRRWRLVVTVEVVFLAGFAADVVVRMIYPDLWHSWNGGEKAMDFSYLNGVVRSQTMPPADPWFGGGYLNYYYYGFIVIATMIKLTGVAPALAYNLAVPTLFALVLASAYTVAYALTRRVGLGLLAAALVVLVGNLYAGIQLAAVIMTLSPVHVALPLLGGVVDFVGGLWQLVSQQLILHHQIFPDLAFRGGPSVNGVPTGWGWDATRVLDGGATINEFPFFTFLYADLHAHMIDLPIMLAVVALATNAALGARPWLGGEGRTRRGEPAQHSGRMQYAPTGEGRSLIPGAGLVMLLVAAIIVGATGPTNTWDLPTAIMLVALGVAVNVYVHGIGHSVARNLWLAAGTAAAVAIALLILTRALYYPFYSHLKNFYSVIPNILLAHTDFGRFLMMWGLFLFILTSYLVVDLWRGSFAWWLRRQLVAGQFVLFYWPRRARVTRLLHAVGRGQQARGRGLVEPSGSLFFLGAGIILAIVALILAAPVLALLLVLLGLALAALLQPARTANGAMSAGTTLTGMHPRVRGFILVLTILALAITAFNEVAYLVDFENGSPNYRMNTVFKLYEQAWYLYAIASATALATLLRAPAQRWSGVTLPSLLRPAPALGIVADTPGRARAVPALSREQTNVRGDASVASQTTWWRPLWLVALGLLLLAAAVYPVVETPLRVQDRASSSIATNAALGLTLDGAAFVRVGLPGEYNALSWLNAHVKGDPTVLAASTGGYGNFAFRVEWLTGLPDVVQWPGEQGQQRYSGQVDTADWPYAPYPNEVGDRTQDVATIYSTTDQAQALALLHKYNVGYVYVGGAERGQPPFDPNGGYPAEGLAKFDAMATGHGPLRLVYNRQGVKIYQVVG